MDDPVATDPLLIAEDAWAYSVPWPNEVRHDAGDAVLFHGLSSHHLDGSASRVRFDARSVERRIAEVRAWFARQGRDGFAWWIGGSATPGDLVARLLAQGAAPEPDEPAVTPMALDRDPPTRATDVIVRPVADLEHYRLMREIRYEAFGMEEADRAEGRARLLDDWRHAQADGNARFLAYLDGEPVAYAVLEILSGGPPYLGGGATLPSARGRGAYRSLVRARWDEAVRRGTPALVIQAGRDSRPILERLGFRAGPPIHVLVDHSGIRPEARSSRAGLR